GAIALRVAVVEDQVIGEVLGRLKERGAPVLNLTKSEPTLETVFVHLVGRGLEDEDMDGQG
ncbi:MAG TPA: ABC transporter, partial [Candidatus Eisenbacteria bacterium]|nr:ABC transporter [Candidatus Eisenbacteria bacterium]